MPILYNALSLLLLHEMRKYLFKFCDVLNQNLTRFGSVLGAHYACGFKLVHHSTCFCISHAKTALEV